ncbi:hypothetical protein MARPU_07510 [Marichromatium purpuratum 984]|uniref:Uncharacterized protein n=1 Tax=Marichromatium purpuratum 984 TaxID=765910 RepID=W0E7G5_MARPU|nr:hypothetical protein [Marichromatium purpuratum]AHF05463.1 hypothetical protein MARPU_07510 [Marichromatium purpuratum 984]
MPIALLYRIDDLPAGAGPQRDLTVPPVLSRTPLRPYDGVEDLSTDRADDHLLVEDPR